MPLPTILIDFDLNQVPLGDPLPASTRLLNSTNPSVLYAVSVMAILSKEKQYKKFLRILQEFLN